MTTTVVDMDRLGKALREIMSTEVAVRKEAENWLTQQTETHFAPLLHGLCQLFSDKSQTTESRMISGILAKNNISKQGVETLGWLGCDEATKLFVLTTCLNLFTDNNSNLQLTSGVIVGNIAILEGLRGNWQVVLPNLIDRFSRPDCKAESFSILRAFEVVLESDTDIPTDLVSQMFSVIVLNMPSASQDPKGFRVAMDVLDLLLPLAVNDFRDPKQLLGQKVLQLIFMNASFGDDDCKVSCLRVLATVLELHLEQMSISEKRATVELIAHILTMSAQGEIVHVALRCWVALCEAKSDMVIESKATIVPLLLSCLGKQFEDEEALDEDYFDLQQGWEKLFGRMNALEFSCRCCGESILQIIVPFVQSNLGSPDYRTAVSAILSLGCLFGSLEVSESELLLSLLTQTVPMLLSFLRDGAHVLIQEAVVVTIGRIAQSHKQVLQNSSAFSILMELMSKCRLHNGNTALTFACILNLEKVMDMLLEFVGPEKEAFVNEANDEGHTALMEACLHELESTVMLLLDHGADRTIQNLSGETAADLCTSNTDKSATSKIPDLLDNYFPTAYVLK